jgi:hypothetical protein
MCVQQMLSGLLENLEISLSLNERQRQLANSSQLIWKLGNERISG